MGEHPEHQRIGSLKRWARLLDAPQPITAPALAMAPRDPISDRYRRVHITGDQARPFGYADRYPPRCSAGLTRLVVGTVGLILLIGAATIMAHLS